MKMDRSGRTLQDYRQLYWDGQKRIAELGADLFTVQKKRNELQAKLDAVQDARNACLLGTIGHGECLDKIGKALQQEGK